jgi:hypothetical protein
MPVQRRTLRERLQTWQTEAPSVQSCMDLSSRVLQVSSAGAVSRKGAGSIPSLNGAALLHAMDWLFSTQQSTDQACLVLLALTWRHAFCWHFPAATGSPTHHV